MVSPLAPCTEHVRKDPVGARHARRQLPEPRVRGEDVNALSVRREKHPALQGLFARIVRFKHRLILRIPFGSEVEPALLHPVIEVVFGDAVRVAEQCMIRLNKLYRGVLNGHSLSSNLQWKRSYMRQL